MGLDEWPSLFRVDGDDSGNQKQIDDAPTNDELNAIEGEEESEEKEKKEKEPTNPCKEEIKNFNIAFDALVVLWTLMHEKGIGLFKVLENFTLGERLKVVKKEIAVKNGFGKQYQVINEMEHPIFGFEVIKNQNGQVLIFHFKPAPTKTKKIIPKKVRVPKKEEIPKAEKTKESAKKTDELKKEVDPAVLVSLLLNHTQRFVIALAEEARKNPKNVHWTKVAKQINYSLSGTTIKRLVKQGILRKTSQGLKIGTKLFVLEKKYKKILEKGKRLLNKMELLLLALVDSTENDFIASFYQIEIAVCGYEIGSKGLQSFIKRKYLERIENSWQITDEGKQQANLLRQIKDEKQKIFLKKIKRKGSR